MLIYIGVRHYYLRRKPGNPLAIPMHTLGIVPLMNGLLEWYANDATACGHLIYVHHWWDKLV